MGVSITRVPPPGSKLRRYVHYAERIANSPEIQTDEPSKATEEKLLLLTERRIWKLPHHLVRDCIVRDALVDLHGKVKVAQLFDEWPSFVDEFTELLVSQAYRDATQKERSAPKPGPLATVFLIVMVSFLDEMESEPNLTRNKYHGRTAKRLGPGVSRSAVRQIVMKVGKTLRSEVVGIDKALCVLAALDFIRSLMRQCDEQHRHTVCSNSDLRKPGRNEQRDAAQ